MASDNLLQQQIDLISNRIALHPNDITLYLQRGKLLQQIGMFDKALNDFTKALQLDPQNTEAKQYSMLLREIFAFTYTDQYNP